MIRITVDKTPLLCSKEIYNIKSDYGSGNVLVTDDEYDIVNMFMTKPKPYRFSYCPKYSVYALASAYDCTHGTLWKAMEETGFATDNINSKDVYDYVFYPKGMNVEDYDFQFEANERWEHTYLTIGSISVAESKLYKQCPDLYKLLKQRKLLVNLEQIKQDLIKDIKTKVNKFITKIKQDQKQLINLGCTLIEEDIYKLTHQLTKDSELVKGLPDVFKQKFYKYVGVFYMQDLINLPPYDTSIYKVVGEYLWNDPIGIQIDETVHTYIEHLEELVACYNEIARIEDNKVDIY